ncbi:pilus assembly protein [Bacillaceae bacterium Marseille-Q3522]|nr:pilus assembly protein [Bacillaceae bacterium Marseille-Q3522]
MRKRNRYFHKFWKNEKGSASIEFLGLLPFYFLFFLLLWQVVASGYAVFSAKTAVNEAAKTFASTNSVYDAEDVAKESLGNSTVITFKKLEIIAIDSNGKFRAKLYTDHPLVFIPNQWKAQTSLPLEQEAVGTVLTRP